ncbi:hypothetical protein BpHYR1_010231 [Brachionus plicatilis]|uniref:Uncharacterized protein n=1 Tax=Brachionus plicatilis TaxID=10195 RepID=A0A3M7Q403_BRAPC|nr:hypothetical protein BpHYR1_010231 [Brachionus plicatilis]
MAKNRTIFQFYCSKHLDRVEMYKTKLPFKLLFDKLRVCNSLNLDKHAMSDKFNPGIDKFNYSNLFGTGNDRIEMSFTTPIKFSSVQFIDFYKFFVVY